MTTTIGIRSLNNRNICRFALPFKIYVKFNSTMASGTHNIFLSIELVVYFHPSSFGHLAERSEFYFVFVYAMYSIRHLFDVIAMTRPWSILAFVQSSVFSFRWRVFNMPRCTDIHTQLSRLWTQWISYWIFHESRIFRTNAMYSSSVHWKSLLDEYVCQLHSFCWIIIIVDMNETIWMRITIFLASNIIICSNTHTSTYAIILIVCTYTMFIVYLLRCETFGLF